MLNRLLALSFSLLFMTGCSTLPHTKQIETEDGSYTYYLSSGKSPTVVLESGLGDDMTSWEPIITELESFSRVFAYNRAGFSGSSSKNKIRNGKVIVNELRALLKRAELTPPYVLVGHSLGGTYMELYAKMYPSEVSGVVLVDPNSSKYPQACKIQKLEFCDPPSGMPAWATLFYPSAVEGEINGFVTTHEQVNEIEDFPSVPLAVISATNKGKGSTNNEKKANELYVKMHKALSEMSLTSKFTTCDTCSHYIQQDDPNLVISAIKWVADNVKQQK